MRTWAICRRSKSPGFTLLEILVVLAIAGLLVGVALPQISGMAERVRIANQRQGIQAAIEELGYRAYATGQVLVIPATPTEKNSPPTTLPLILPTGWRLVTHKPILYAINGICSGGGVELIDPEQRTESYQLLPPHCRLTPKVNNG